MDLTVPKSYAVGEGPVIFLAGPIRGAPKWHYDAIDYLKDKSVTIAAPIREIRDDLRKYLLNEYSDPNHRQRTWELVLLNEAWRDGCVMFWLPGELEHRCEKAYGAMTRMELGETIARHKFGPKTNFVVGTDGNFSEFRTMLLDIEKFAPGTPIYSTLEDTCDAALKKVFG